MNNITTSDALKRLVAANPVWRLIVGDAQSTGQYFSAITAGNSKAVVLKNPTSDTHYGIFNSTIRVSSEAAISKRFNVTEDTEGNPPDTGITNKRSKGNGTTASVHIGGDNETGVYSGGTEFNDKGAGGGSGGGGGAVPGDAGSNVFDNIIDPGDNMLVRVSNESGAEMSYASIDIDWAEIPSDDYPV